MYIPNEPPWNRPCTKAPWPLFMCLCARDKFQRAFAGTIYGDLLLSCSHPRTDNAREWGLLCELVCNLFMARILLADVVVVVVVVFVVVGVGLVPHTCVCVSVVHLLSDDERTKFSFAPRSFVCIFN